LASSFLILAWGGKGEGKKNERRTKEESMKEEGGGEREIKRRPAFGKLVPHAGQFSMGRRRAGGKKRRWV
jgi:hypothetical protein